MRARLNEIEEDEQLVGAGLGGLLVQTLQAAEQHQVLAAGEGFVKRSELAGECDLLAHLTRILDDIMASDLRDPESGLSSVVSRFTVVVLPAPLGPSRASTVPGATENETLLTTVCCRKTWSARRPRLRARSAVRAVAVSGRHGCAVALAFPSVQPPGRTGGRPYGAAPVGERATRPSTVWADWSGVGRAP